MPALCLAHVWGDAAVPGCGAGAWEQPQHQAAPATLGAAASVREDGEKKKIIKSRERCLFSETVWLCSFTSMHRKCHLGPQKSSFPARKRPPTPLRTGCPGRSCLTSLPLSLTPIPLSLLLTIDSSPRNLPTSPATTPATPWRPASSASSAPAATPTCAEVGPPRSAPPDPGCWAGCPRVPMDDGGKAVGGQGTTSRLGWLVEVTQTRVVQKPPRSGLGSPGSAGAGTSGSAVTPLLSPRSVSGVHQNDQPRRGARHQEADVGGREGRLRGHRSVTGTGQQPPGLPLPS